MRRALRARSKAEGFGGVFLRLCFCVFVFWLFVWMCFESVFFGMVGQCLFSGRFSFCLDVGVWSFGYGREFVFLWRCELVCFLMFV